MDPLADLPGPEDFDALLAREELRRGRTGELLSVAMIDVDGLRRVNREQGAGAGSEVLRLCVTTLRSTLRAVDEIARVGPDEFAALLHAHRLAQRQHLGRPLRGRAGRLSPSSTRPDR